MQCYYRESSPLPRFALFLSSFFHRPLLSSAIFCLPIRMVGIGVLYVAAPPSMKGAFPCSAVLCGALLCLFLETSFSLNILVVKCCRRLPPSLRFLSLLLCICWERTMLYKYNQRHFKVVVPTRTTTSLRFRMVRQEIHQFLDKCSH